MGPHRDDQSDEESRKHSRRRQRQHSIISADSIDSGYGGSSAHASPQPPQKRALESHLPSLAQPEEMLEPRAAKTTHGTGEATDSDSDYDPRAKYYLTVDDDDYESMSFRGGESSRSKSRGSGRDKRERKDESSSARRQPSPDDRPRRSSHRRRSRSRISSDSDSDTDSDDDHRKPRSHHHSRSQPARSSSRRDSNSSRSSRSKSRPRRELIRRPLSPIYSDSEDWDTSPERRPLSRTPARYRSRNRSTSRRHQRHRSSSSSLDEYSTDSDSEDLRHRRTGRSRSSRAGSHAGSDRAVSRRRDRSEGTSSSFRGAADMDMAWYKTFKDRLTKGVDMKQVRKVGLEAAAVSAIKVAVGTSVPWKQRIPKTIAVGLAAAVTDFLVSKTGFKPKGLLGTVFVRQFVEIALANLIINPTSNKVQQKWKAAAGAPGGGDQSGMNTPAGGRAKLGASATTPQGRR